MIVKEVLTKLAIPFTTLELGVAEIRQDMTSELRDTLKGNLLRYGLELLDDNKSNLIARIRNVIIELVHYTEAKPQVNYSDFITEKLQYDYTYLSNIFSQATGMTIRQFIILHKIEKVKELLLYEEYNLSEIAYMLHYSSVSHLSNQFKKITGLSPSYYKLLKHRRNATLENL